MANLTPAALQALQVNLSMRFQTMFDQTPTLVDQIASVEMEEDAGQVVFAWLDRVPQFREWLGERQFNNFAPRDWIVKARDWEQSGQIDRNTVDDDKIRVYANIVSTMASAAKKYPDVLVKEALQTGSSTLCYDGQYLFDTDHPANIDFPSEFPVMSNLFTGSPLGTASWANVHGTMAGYIGADGQPLLSAPDTVIVPPQLGPQARALFNTQIVGLPVNSIGGNSGGTMVGAAGVSNTGLFQGTAKVIEMPELANEPTVWYAAKQAGAMRGLVFLNRKAPEFVVNIAPNAPSVFRRKMYEYGWDARGAVAPAVWFAIARCEG